MNIWDYFEQEAKKKWQSAPGKYPKLSVKDYSSSWNALITRW